MLKLDYFMHVSPLDLIMGYYHIKLSPGSKQLCTIVLPWGNCENQKLPIGVCKIPKIYFSKIFLIYLRDSMWYVHI